MSAARGSLLGIEHLDAAEILKILKFARRMNPDKPRPLLKGKRVVLLFYESSTRTRSSFEIAAKALGAHTVLIQAAGSSIEKGESLLDTGYTVRALGADVIVKTGCTNILRRRCWMPTLSCATRRSFRVCRLRLSGTFFIAGWRAQPATCSAGLA